MAARTGYSITVTAVDKASGTLDTLSKRVEVMNKRIALAAAPFKKLEESFAKFGKVTGMDRIATGFTNIATAGTETFRSLLRVVEPLAAITGAASVAGLYRLATAWGAFGTQLGQQAARAGLAAGQLQALQGAAQLAGISADALTSGMTTLNDNLRDAAFGAAPQFIQALHDLGLKYDDIRKKSPADALKNLADKVAGIKNPTDQAQYAVALFGSSAEAMLPFLRKGGAGIADLTAKASLLGGSLGKDGVEAADRFRQSQQALVLAVQGLQNAIGAELAPALTPLLDQMAAWIAANREWIAQGIAAKVEQFGSYLKAVDWVAIGQDIAHIADDVRAVADALGGWKTAGELLIAFFAGRFLVQMLLPLARISATLLAVPKEAAVAVAKADAELAMIGKLGAAKAASGGSSINWMRLAKMAAGPFGLAYDYVTGGAPDEGRAASLEELRRADPNTLNDDEWRRANTPQPDTRPWYERGPTLLGGSDKPVPMHPGQQRENALSMAEVYRQHGYSQEGIAALLGSGIQESGLNPTAGLGSAHVGISQWDDPRQQRIAAHFGKRVQDMTPAEQAEATAWEIDSDPRFVAVRSGVRSRDLVAANDVVTRQYEAPGNYGTEVPNRLGLSRGVLASLPSGDPVSLPPVGSTGMAGANGKVDMNVRVVGPAQVMATSSGDVGLKVETRNVAKDGY